MFHNTEGGDIVHKKRYLLKTNNIFFVENGLTIVFNSMRFLWTIQFSVIFYNDFESYFGLNYVGRNKLG